MSSGTNTTASTPTTPSTPTRESSNALWSQLSGISERLSRKEMTPEIRTTAASRLTDLAKALREGTYTSLPPYSLPTSLPPTSTAEEQVSFLLASTVNLARTHAHSWSEEEHNLNIARLNELVAALRDLSTLSDSSGDSCNGTGPVPSTGQSSSGSPVTIFHKGQKVTPSMIARGECRAGASTPTSTRGTSGFPPAAVSPASSSTAAATAPRSNSTAGSTPSSGTNSPRPLLHRSPSSTSSLKSALRDIPHRHLNKLTGLPDASFASGSGSSSGPEKYGIPSTMSTGTGPGLKRKKSVGFTEENQVKEFKGGSYCNEGDFGAARMAKPWVRAS